MNWLERDAASMWQPFTQDSPSQRDRRTVITRIEGSWLYDVDGNRVLDGSLAGPTATSAGPTATKEPSLPPPDPDLPSGPSPTDPEGPTDPKPDEPTNPTGPDEPPAVGRLPEVVG
ncbi:hypothetical protein HC028_01355 [Planosporangium flavigriseum]|uniref:Uncharacterized protein n=1 Tax=Planosporangium flavigriseum TaxID=373681 RepID=A0A8J3LWL2_9ACTN|nr:hypothetical protein [Planosporangium flavigriseum]NJC63163.1 hypothetical protein [Planosporangium flavigriseum]GIG72435.1 hypothetical protein Pfl04_08390 [Planosporangium flavigriseum]